LKMTRSSDPSLLCGATRSGRLLLDGKTNRCFTAGTNDSLESTPSEAEVILPKTAVMLAKKAAEPNS
jgi:hypothetical protein